MNLRSAALARCRTEMRPCEAHGHLVWGTYTYTWRVRNGREAAEAELTRSNDVGCRDDDGIEELDDVDDARAPEKVRDETRRDAFSAPRHSPAPFDGPPLSPGLASSQLVRQASPSRQLVMTSSRLIIASQSSRGSARSMNRRILRPATARPSVLSCSWVANRPHRYRAPVDELRTCFATLARVAKRCARRFT